MRRTSPGSLPGRRGGPVLALLPPILACLLAGPLAAEPLSLAGALRMAGTGSAAADSAQLATAAAREDTVATRALYLPEVTFDGGFRALDERPGLVSQPMSLGPMTLPSLVFPTEDKDSWRYRAAVRYLVWDFGKRSSAVAAAQSRAQAVQAGGSAQTRRAQNEAASRYLALLNIKAQKQVVAQRRQTLAAHLGMARAQFEHGVVARNDLLRTEVTLRQVDDADSALDRTYASGLEALNVAIGVDPASARELPESLPAPPPIPWDESACRRKAVEDNETVRAMKAKVEANRNLLVLHRRDYYPNLVAEADHTYVQDSFLNHPHENAFAIGLSWKVFDGARAAKVHRSEAETDESARALVESERNAGNEATAALRAFQQSIQELRTAARNVESAEENLRIVQDQYQEGLVRNADVLDAESVLAESRSSQAERRYRAYSQQAALLTVLGEDLSAFYDQLPSLEK